MPFAIMFGRSDLTQNSNNDSSKDSDSKKYLEEEYLATETKVCQCIGSLIVMIIEFDIYAM